MPSVQLKGSHDCGLEGNADDDVLTLVCQCGWSQVLTEEEAWGEERSWRLIAKAHQDEAANS